jgi:hypothetical protein
VGVGGSGVDGSGSGSGSGSESGVEVGGMEWVEVWGAGVVCWCVW